VRRSWRESAESRTLPHNLWLRIPGSNVHAFELNWLPEFCCLRAGNLVTARPLKPDPASYEKLLAITGKNLELAGRASRKPNWRLSDFFGM
jgi:hypothetical protein